MISQIFAIFVDQINRFLHNSTFAGICQENSCSFGFFMEFAGLGGKSGWSNDFRETADFQRRRGYRVD